jgi:hypothetical protein
MHDPSDDSETIAPRASCRADPELKNARALTRWLGRASTSQRQLLDLFVAALVADFKEGGDPRRSPRCAATTR